MLFNDGMVVGGFEPGALGALAVRYLFGVALWLLASICLLDIVATLFLIPERCRAELQ